MGYFQDDVPPEKIEEYFAVLEGYEYMTNNSEEAARQTFYKTADPNLLPVDVWYAMEEEDNLDDMHGDFDPVLFDEEEEEAISRRHREKIKTGGSSSHFKSGETVGSSSALQTETVGAGIEIWGRTKVEYDEEEAPIFDEFPNVVQFNTVASFKELCQTCPIHVVDKINAASIRSIAGNHVDAFIIDPPLGFNGYTYDSLYHLLKKINDGYERFFMAIWVNPEDMSGVCETALRAKLRFCDSFAIELVDETLRSINVSSTQYFRCTRMMVLYSSPTVQRNDLAQQRIKDTGWGISIPNGKSYGRHSTPLVPHRIFETMLPNKKGKRKRVFVELWPSYFYRREGWIYIDQSSSPK